MPHKTIELRETISASPAAVWHAITELGPSWLGGFRFETDWQVGGSFSICGKLQNKTYRETGQLLMLDPPGVVQYSHWSRLWRLPNLPENHAILTLRLEPENAETRVLLHHELPEVQALAEHSQFFWQGALWRLKRLVETP